MATSNRRRWVLWGLAGALGGCTGSGQVFVPVEAGLAVDAGVAPGVNGITLGAAIGPTQTPEVPPPPISGGTLLVTRDGLVAVAADPDRDRVWFVDLPGRVLLGGVTLERGDEPGRLVEDDAGRVHVALRRGGAVVTLHVATRAIVARRPACAAPRGVAFDGRTRVLHVACAGGELVTLPADGGPPTRTLRLERDLRDVIVDGDTLLVSRFRAAELLRVGADGSVTERLRPASSPEGRDAGAGIGGQPGVAWRAVAGPGGAVMLHQRSQTQPVRAESGGYGGNGDSPCRAGIVQSAVSVLGRRPTVVAPALSQVVLAVDVALSPDGASVAVAAPGSAPFPGVGQVFEGSLSAAATALVGGCASLPAVHVSGQAVAVAYSPDGLLVVQTREPATLQVRDGDAAVALGGESREDTGHTLFHSNAGAFVACASCHPEGGDDGRVWSFHQVGARRTQSLFGGLAGMAPFHWDGDMTTFPRLVEEVFGRRMNGGGLRADQVAALERWSGAQSAPRAAPPGDPAAVDRGAALFAEASVGCASCHGGARLTNNATVDVGTGGAFQVPSLTGVAWRTPLMHDGCAPTLRDRFGACGGGDRHGHTSQLAPAQIDDLVAYLETL
ncbi:MAG: c-type cytochrome [Deltaproteobacteria bacterium]|nr:c-type cytochrome [Myxococcales bacterium]MDP3212459.1 c-type cytochrome [Deltaproteobacteria bacterium]